MSDRTPETRQLENRVAIVTGGASGIGQATCLALAAEGARVVVVDLDPPRIEQTLRALRATGHAETLGLSCDVSSEADMDRMARQTLERFGRIDALVACAGILRGRGSHPRPLADVTPDEWDQVLDTNLKGTFLSNRAVLPAMIRQRSGNIVNVSSVSGRKGRPFDAPYCASKAGIIGMTEALAEEVRSNGIRVQVIMPDAVDTPIWDQNGHIPRPPDALPADRVAGLIVYMIAQPDDCILLDTVIAPFRSRRRRGLKKPGPEAAGSSDAAPPENT